MEWILVREPSSAFTFMYARGGGLGLWEVHGAGGYIMKVEVELRRGGSGP